MINWLKLKIKSCKSCVIAKRNIPTFNEVNKQYFELYYYYLYDYLIFPINNIIKKVALKFV